MNNQAYLRVGSANNKLSDEMVFHGSGSNIPTVMRLEAYIGSMSFQDNDFFPVLIINDQSLDSVDCSWIFYPAKKTSTFNDLV